MAKIVKNSEDDENIHSIYEYLFKVVEDLKLVQMSDKDHKQMGNAVLTNIMEFYQ
jgi:hypothetical protein